MQNNTLAVPKDDTVLNNYTDSLCRLLICCAMLSGEITFTQRPRERMCAKKSVVGRRNSSKSTWSSHSSKSFCEGWRGRSRRAKRSLPKARRTMRWSGMRSSVITPKYSEKNASASKSGSTVKGSSVRVREVMRSKDSVMGYKLPACVFPG